MAVHIASFLESKSCLGLKIDTTEASSPASGSEKNLYSPVEEHGQYVWRMQQTGDICKHQPSPAKERSLKAGRFSSLVTRPPIVPMDSKRPGGGERRRQTKKAMARGALPRHRNASTSDLDKMATVYEAAIIDSPTIPGRIAIHERSGSAPESWRDNMFGEQMMYRVKGPALEDESVSTAPAALNSEVHTKCTKSSNVQRPPQAVPTSKLTLPLKQLSPLIIPSSSAPPPRLAHQAFPTGCNSDEEIPPKVPPKSPRLLASSRLRQSPCVPSSASVVGTPSTALTSYTNTPITAMSSTPELHRTLKQWAATPGHLRAHSETSPKIQSQPSHRRHESDKGPSTIAQAKSSRGKVSAIMDRGRPQNLPLTQATSTPASVKRKASSHTLERQAFESLPQGNRPKVANHAMPALEIEKLRKQAVEQASTFDVLKPTDVDSLSRELRSLDSHCSSLRSTYRTLRSSRRALHIRISAYRSARLDAKLLIAHEDALTELDKTIDEWITRIEYTANRQMRVRQKLLEHVAGVLLVQPRTEKDRNMGESKVNGNESPENNAIPRPLAAPVKASSPPALVKRSDVESIKIYAHANVYDLMADVEEEMNRMSKQIGARKQRLRQSGLEKGQETLRTGDDQFMLSALTFAGLPERKKKAPLEASWLNVDD